MEKFVSLLIQVVGLAFLFWISDGLKPAIGGAFTIVVAILYLLGLRTLSLWTSKVVSKWLRKSADESTSE